MRRTRGSTAPPRGLGFLGESWAKTYLERRGYRILERNFRCPLGEIDLVAEEGGEVVFIEVKTRKNTDFGYPEEQIPFSKQEKIATVAQWYLKHRERRERPARFDVVSIVMEKD